MPNKIQWEKVWARPHNIQRMAFLMPFFVGDRPDDLPLRFKHMAVVPQGTKYGYYLEKNEWQELLESLVEWQMKSGAEHHAAMLRGRFEEYEAAGARVVGKNLSDWPGEDLLAWFEDYSDKYKNITPYAFSPWGIDYLMVQKLKIELHKISAQKADHWFEVIATPTERNQMLTQQQELLALAAAGRLDQIDELLEKYKWVSVYNIGDKPMTKEAMLKQLEGTGDFDAELERRDQELDGRRLRYSEVVDEISAQGDLKKMIEIVHEYTVLRDDRVDYWRRTLTDIELFYRELAKRAGLPFEDILEMTSFEIFDYLRQGRLPDGLTDRKNGHAIRIEDGEIKIVTSPAEIEALKAEVSDQNNGVKELKGIAAYPGVVRAKARVIESLKDIGELQEDEVLVAYHTEPSHIVAMKKAAAIVTDEGGITSHAAIVSRELKTPCVTATKNGSLVIKTGDMVEVDATAGVVRILKASQ